MGIATTSVTAAIRDLSDQNSQGTRLGVTSTDTIGFYGVTTCVAASTIIGSLTLATASAFSTGGSTSFGFSSNTIDLAVLNTLTQLKNMGLIS